MANIFVATLIPGILTFIVHVAFAIGVGADAARMRDRHVGTFLVGGGMWAFATLLGGLVVVAIYWLIHHSTLHPLPPPEKI